MAKIKTNKKNSAIYLRQLKAESSTCRILRNISNQTTEDLCGIKPGQPSSEEQDHSAEMRLNFIIDYWQDFAVVDNVVLFEIFS